MIRIVDGDLLSANENIICHQVNCMGVMGSGVALQIREKWPVVYKCYLDFCRDADARMSPLLGEAQIVAVDRERGKFVANLFGQNKYGSSGVFTDTGALCHALSIVRNKAQMESYSVAIPYNIGCCRGGGDWREISAMIEQVFAYTGVPVTFYRWRG